MDNFANLKSTIDVFCSISGEMVSLPKSFIMFSANSHPKFCRIVRKKLGMKDQKEFGSYLGCPMQVSLRTTKCFKDVVQKISSRITSWKYMKLNQMGKLLPINNILVALASHIIINLPHAQIYHQANIFSPVEIFVVLEKRPIYSKKTALLEMHKQEVGLSFRNIELLNKAFGVQACLAFTFSPEYLGKQDF